MVFNILTTCFTAIAIVVSVIGIASSRNSNKTSKEALQVSKESLLIQTRPWITIKVSKQKESERYYNIVKEENSIYWKLTLILENIGSSPATNIRYPQLFNLRDIVGTNETHLLLLDNIILGHSQKYKYDLSIGGQVKPGKDIDKMLERYLKNDAGLKFTFVVYYNGLYEQEKEFKTKTVFSVNANSVSMLNGCEMV